MKLYNSNTSNTSKMFLFRNKAILRYFKNVTHVDLPRLVGTHFRWLLYQYLVMSSYSEFLNEII